MCGTDFNVLGRYADIKLPFILKKMEILDFQVIFTKEGAIWVDKIEMIPYEAATSGVSLTDKEKTVD